MLLISNILAKTLAPSFPKLFLDRSIIFMLEAKLYRVGSKAKENKSASYFCKVQPERLRDSSLGD